MKIIKWDEFIENGLPLEDGQKVSVTVGVFDGVHKGHKALIERVVAHNKDNVPVAVTFREPAYKNERAPFIIQSFEERAAALEVLGIKILIVIDFTEEFGSIPGLDFLEILLTHTNINFFAVGANFRCGCGLDTDAVSIKKFFTEKGICAEIIPEVVYNGEPISSSRIREALAEGDLDLAEAMM